jgi:hypothetical protein
LSACDKTEQAVISNDYISLQLWSDWKYKPLSGIDTIEGIFESEDEQILFSYTGLTTSGWNHTPGDLFYEELTVDGAAAQIVKIKSGDDLLLIMFFDKGDGNHYGSLRVVNPQDDQRFINVFKSLRFQ